MLSEWLGADLMPVNGLTGDAVSELCQKVQKILIEPASSVFELETWSSTRQFQELQEVGRISLASIRQQKNWHKKSARDQTHEIDRVLLHPFWGIILFFTIMAGLFTSIFWAAAPLMDG